MSDTTRYRSVLSRPLRRGAACMNCRFLKIKCDAVRPQCGPCRRTPKDDPCEYSDGPARSRTKALEDTVQRLEARLHELENPELNTPAVSLHNPYSTYQPPRLAIPNEPQRYHSLPSTPYSGGISPPAHLVPLSPLSATDSSPLFGQGLSPLGIFDSRALAVATPDSSASSNLDLHDIYDSSIRAFLPHALHFGFFLDPQRLLSSPSGLTRTSPALVYTICAFGGHLSRDQTSEDRFLLRALQSVPTTAITDHYSLVRAIQTHVLLAYYLWRTGALLRARVHAAAAGAIVLGTGLHSTVHSSSAPVLDVTSEGLEYPHVDERRISPPADALEAAERIRAFWAVFLLQKSLAIVSDKPAEVRGVFELVTVDVPWPSETDEAQLAQAQGTVNQYLAGAVVHHPTAANVSALLVKAHILLHRAVYMHGQWQAASAAGQQPQALVSAFQSLEALVAALRAQLPRRYPEHEDERVWLAHTLLDGAALRLHELSVLYGYADHNAHARYVQTAMELLRDADGTKIAHPIVSFLWSLAINVLAAELKWTRDFEYDQELRGCLAAGLKALASGGEGSAVMRRDYVRAREATAELGPL
ncbi:Zn(2)-C6 fungal-type domain-containing protein [Mycena kentingensis (nom. inval.)]|nr:Zn(2)-C6 fungal-type domain-containing protein [Mycena kentingensis (nom. inval.)]